MVLEWEQMTGLLYAAGDVRHIRVWDTHKEVKIQDIPTGADSCVTCLASDSAERSLMIAGCGDGTVRMYDRRQPPSSRWAWASKNFNCVVNRRTKQPTQCACTAIAPHCMLALVTGVHSSPLLQQRVWRSGSRSV